MVSRRGLDLEFSGGVMDWERVLEFLRALYDHRVEYMLVGAVGMNFKGSFARVATWISLCGQSPIMSRDCVLL
jgi:hypothetical protein